MLDLKIKHNFLIDKIKKVPRDGYIHFEDVLSNISLGLKAKVVKYSKNEFSLKVLKGFNMNSTSNQKAFAIDFFTSLNKLRNKVMHYDAVIDWKWKTKWGIFELEEYIRIGLYFTSKIKSLKANKKTINKFEKQNIKKIIGE